MLTQQMLSEAESLHSVTSYLERHGQGLVPSLLGSVYLLEDIRMPWEGAPHHTEGTGENTKVGSLFLSIINNWEHR